MSDYTSPSDEEHFAAIGRLTVAWALLEAGLDMSVGCIHLYAGGSQAIEPELPRALERKMRYLRKAFNQIGPLSRWKETFPTLAEQIKVASDFRHDIVHGFAISHPPGSIQVTLLRFLWEPQNYRIKPITVTAELLLREALKAQKLAGQTLSLANELAENFSPK